MPHKKKAKPNGNGAGRQHPEDASELLVAQQEKIKRAAETLAGAKNDEARRTALTNLATLWAHYSELEHEIAFKAYREAGVDEQVLAEATIGHDLVAVLVRSLLRRPPSDAATRAGIAVLVRLLQWHTDEPEKAASLQAAATESGVDMAELGKRLADRVHALEDEEEQRKAVPYPRLLHTGGPSTRSMESLGGRGRARFEGEGRRGRRDISEYEESGDRMDAPRERGEWAARRGMDEYEDDDQRRFGGRGRRYGREAEDRGGWRDPSRAGGGMRDRDWDERREARFREEDHDRDERWRGRSSGGMSDEGDDGRGWYGEPRRHAEAGRRGWARRDEMEMEESDRRQGGEGRRQSSEDEEEWLPRRQSRRRYG